MLPTLVPGDNSNYASPSPYKETRHPSKPHYLTTRSWQQNHLDMVCIMYNMYIHLGRKPAIKHQAEDEKLMKESEKDLADN